MFEVAIDKGIFRDSGDIVHKFFSERGINLQEFRTPRDAGIDYERRGYACATYMISNIEIMRDLVKALRANNPYSKPKIFVQACGEWQMIDEEKASVQNITVHGPVNQLAGRDINIEQYMDPKIYLNILEEAIQNDANFSAATKAEKESILSKIKALKDDPWISQIGAAAIVECGKRLLGLG